jgi:hypothetical protein
MATTTNGVFEGTRVEQGSFADRFHLVRRQIGHTVKDAYNYTKHDAIPAIAKGTEAALCTVDCVCTKANRAAVKFLVKYPGIAMALSPQTIVRMAVAEHYKEMAGQPAADWHHVGDAIENAEHIAVNITQ